MFERTTYPRFPKVIAYELDLHNILRVWGYGDTEEEALQDAQHYVHTTVQLKTKVLDPDTTQLIDALLQSKGAQTA